MSTVFTIELEFTFIYVHKAGNSAGTIGTSLELQQVEVVLSRAQIMARIKTKSYLYAVDREVLR